MLNVENLYKQYKKNVAVNNITFRLNPGEISVLLGPNGAGKSTTIKAITGLISYKGLIRVNNYPNTSIEAKKVLSYIPEIPQIFEYLTVMEHCRFMCKAYKIDNAEQTVENYLRIFEMEENVDKLGRELSKGMQQKLSIICGLITNPAVILFDEPLIGLDPKAIRECKNIFVKLRENNVTILISTHIIDTLSEIWDRVLIMNKGGLIFEKSREEFEAEHKDMSLEELFFRITEGN